MIIGGGGGNGPVVIVLVNGVFLVELFENKFKCFLRVVAVSERGEADEVTLVFDFDSFRSDVVAVIIESEFEVSWLVVFTEFVLEVVDRVEMLSMLLLMRLLSEMWLDCMVPD